MPKMSGQSLEIDVMKKIAFQLERLEPAPRQRVFRYLAERQAEEKSLVALASMTKNGQTQITPPPNDRIGYDLDE